MAMGYVRLPQQERVAKLLEAMLESGFPEIKPQLDPQSELGFSFPLVNRLLGIGDKESNDLLESLANQGILVRRFFDKFLFCPQCRSLLLRPTYSCAKCGSGNISRGRVLEHLSCKHTGLEDEFLFRGKLICPRCKLELRTLDIDYRSLGVLYQCYDCRDVTPFPALKWRCLRCAAVFSAEKVQEVNAYSYALNEDKKNWLKFELKPKGQFIHFLRREGYRVEENAKLQGGSGIEHNFDLLAIRPLSILNHKVAIGVEIATRPVELDRVFDFDDKAYDCSISYKVLIAIPGVTSEAERFASRQRIRVLDIPQLEALLSGVSPLPMEEMPAEKMEERPFQFTSRTALLEHLRGKGYQVKENGKIRGHSGAEHGFDIIASRDDGLIVHRIVIGIEAAAESIGIQRILDFDAKAYDCGISDKVLIAIPGLTEEAARFARRQRIHVFEMAALAP